MLDLGNAGERLFVSSPPVVFPALGGGRQIERGKINHTVDAKSVRRSVLSALRRISLSSTGKEAKMNHESGYGRAHRQAEHIFRNLLPAHGMAVREGQIALCHAMLDALFNKEVLLCEAGVGIGKTLAYLVACVLWQQQRPAALVEPVVISTSSVTLQEAILREYLPFLSQVLLQEHIIQAPICAVVRKGKERFACDLRLQLRKTQVKQRGQGHDAEMRSLYNVSRNLDLDQAEGLSNFDRRLICVPEHCPKSCSARRSCRYRKYLEEANGRRVTIQICNHNFLLADATHRQEKWPRLLKNYQALVIDEAHKLPEAAAQMYGRRFSVQDGENLCRLLEKSHCTHTAQQLRERLTALQAAFCADEIVNAAVAFCPSNVQNAALLSAQAAFRQAAVTRTAKPLPAWPLHRLRESADVLQLFIEQNSNCILYIQYDSDGKPTLCADCRDLPARLDKALWSVRQAAILTSGTLSAGGNFTHTVQRIGLNNPQTFRAESPFDYKRNCILYFPKRTSTPFDEVEWLSQEIEQLVQVCHGHALVLFTSYDQMGRVQQRLQGRVAYPLLTARRNGQLFVQAFKQLSNAVLFAAGPCWEGVDFPGDRVSLLIIIRLPFPVPDPVSDAEKAKYPDLHSYIQAEVIPTMQKKLRQGFGRAIRTETDTCTVAILDPRAAPGGWYHRAALDALPKMNMTQDIKDVEHFIRAVKGAEYFFA